MPHVSKIPYDYAIACILLWALAIPTLYFGILDEDSTCQRGARAGMTLSTWVKFSGVFYLIIPIAYTYLLVVTTNSAPAYKLAQALVSVIRIHNLFRFVWLVIGVVIISTKENSQCVVEGQGMAVMAIIWLLVANTVFLTDMNQTVVDVLRSVTPPPVEPIEGA